MTPPDGTADRVADRLDSWKEIAAFLGRGLTTVQRWEETEGLPVRRQAHAKRGSVYALRSELAAWRDRRAVASRGATPRRRRVSPVLTAAVAVAAVVFLGVVLFRRDPAPTRR